MKFQILNNEELGFFDDNGVKKALIKLSGSNFVIDPIDNGSNIIMGQGNTANDLELGILSLPINMTFLGGGTISSNGSILNIGDPTNNDNVVLYNTTFSSSVTMAAGLSGSFTGSHYGNFYGYGGGLTGVNATLLPGGENKDIQFNDGGTDTSGSTNFTFDKTTNAISITGSLNISGSLNGDISGSITADSFIGNGSGLTGVTSTFSPVGEIGSLQFKKSPTEVSGSGDVIYDITNNSLILTGELSSSTLTSPGASLTGSLSGSFTGIATNISIINDLSLTGNFTASNNISASGNIFADSASLNFIQPGGFSDPTTGGNGLNLTIKGQDSTNDSGVGGNVSIRGGEGTPQGNGIVYIGNSTGGTNVDAAYIQILGAPYINAAGPSTGGSLKVDGGGQTVFKVLYDNTNDITSWTTSRNLHILGADTYRFDKSSFYIGTGNQQGGHSNGVSASFEFRSKVQETYDSTLHIRPAGNPGGFGQNQGLHLRSNGYNTTVGTGGYMPLLFKTSMSPSGAGNIRGGYTYNGKFAWGATPNENASKYFTIHSTSEFKNGLTVSGSLTAVNNVNIQGTLSLPGITNVSASIASGGGGGGGGTGDGFPYTGSANISGSLEIEGSGSTIFEVNGSSGQLFSITDSLSGSLFAVSDVSGLPILEVFSNDTVKMGSFNNEALEISGSDVNFNNLPTSDPGVSGRLFQTGSDAIGATAGTQLVCISQG